jgi:HPt (histidine-containing phosphotransfer) domain-containing protein
MAEEAGLGLLNDEQARLADSRAQFVSSLGRRLEAVRQALGALERSPRSAAHRDNLRRRVHAMGAAAGVLGFQSVFEAFREVESVLSRAAGAGKVAPSDLSEVARTLDLVPSLVLGAQVSRASGPEGLRAVFEPSGEGWPLCVLLFGAAPLAEALVAEAAGSSATIECARTDDAERA